MGRFFFGSFHWVLTLPPQNIADCLLNLGPFDRGSLPTDLGIQPAGQNFQ
jgi:hypothetical protein